MINEVKRWQKLANINEHVINTPNSLLSFLKNHLEEIQPIFKNWVKNKWLGVDEDEWEGNNMENHYSITDFYKTKSGETAAESLTDRDDMFPFIFRFIEDVDDEFMELGDETDFAIFKIGGRKIGMVYVNPDYTEEDTIFEHIISEPIAPSTYLAIDYDGEWFLFEKTSIDNVVREMYDIGQPDFDLQQAKDQFFQAHVVFKITGTIKRIQN
jgi:hypothetical protein